MATAISANGRYIVYSTTAHNVVPGDHNKLNDVFRYDAVLDETILVSQTLGGLQTDKFSVRWPDQRQRSFHRLRHEGDQHGCS